MANTNIQLNIGDEIGFVITANGTDDNDRTVFFPVAQITERDGERAYFYAYPDGEISRSAIRQSQLANHTVRVRRVETITPAAQTGMLCLSNRKTEFVEAMKRGTDSDLEVFPDWERDAFVVVNHDKGNEYKVNLRSEDNQVFADCSCADYTYRKRVCKHISAVIADSFFGLGVRS